MALIDTHFHLDYYKNHSYWYERINELGQYTLCVTNSPEVYLSCKRLYKETKYIKFALGYNPQVANSIKFSKNTFLEGLQTATYIGEVGLDFSPKYVATRTSQIEAFRFICNEAQKTGKIISVHSRKAEKEVLNILSNYRGTRAIIHWYTGDATTMEQLLEIGCYFSINSNMCTSGSGKSILSKIPLDRLLIESDGPFSVVGAKKYTPLLLKESYSIISNILKRDDLERIVFNNFKTLLSKY